MFSVKMSGFDKLQKELGEAQRAFASLDGTIATLKFDPSDAQSVRRAIQEMEAAVDAKTASHAHNALVRQVGEAMKQKFKTRLQARAGVPAA